MNSDRNYKLNKKKKIRQQKSSKSKNLQNMFSVVFYI